MTQGPVPLLILGAGRFAADVADMVRDIPGLAVAGFIEGIDRARCRASGQGLPVHWIDDVGPLAGGHKAVAAIGDPRRSASIRTLEEMGFEFATLVHPAAHVAPSAEIGAGTVVGPGAVVAAEATVGRHVLINRGALIGHHTRIGDCCTIGPGVNVASSCSIGARSFVGIGATVIEEITLGADSFVAAGALVVRSFADGARIAGAPARKMPMGGR
jgi:sugar O-acyltransferase (sialic acid O-acetyltransferase NeuD family)